MDELKPCPFCGKQPHIFRGFMPSEDGTVYQLLCINPDCKNPSMTSFNPTKQMAIDEWNERGESMTDLEEKLVELLKEIGMLEIEDILYTAKYLIAHGVTVKEPQKPIARGHLLENSPCWFEEVYENGNYALEPVEITKGTGSNYYSYSIGSENADLHDGHFYNKTWRCWAEKPTEEERKAAEWE